MKYPKLFEKGRIGNLELKNRIVMTAMGCSLASSTGEASDQIIRYYAERARGGVGLIITEITRIDDETGVGTPNQLSVTKESDIPQLARLAEAVHAYGAKIFVQLHHPGNQTPSRLIGGRQPVSASDVTCSIIGEKPRPLTTEEVEAMVKKFVKGAYIAHLTGIDGVEIHAAHGYLVNQFLSPHTNHRTDKYGGDFFNRMRFLTEIIKGIQYAVGPKFPISVRIDGNEYIDDGIDDAEGIHIARYLESLGIQAINVSCGTYESGHTIVEPNFYEEGWKKHLGANIRKSVKIPVIAVDDIKHPAVAEQLLEEGACDFAGLGRANLADPAFANKARSGQDVLIRKCIGCMECFRILNLGLPLACTLNPVLGRENHWGEDKLVKNGNGKTVAVIGGGPAGMQAALVLAKRGFHTVLFEKSDRLGGTANLAAIPPHKQMIAEFVQTQEAELAQAGVEVRLYTPATVEAVKALNAEGVFLAVGGTPIRPNLPGIEKAISAEDVLAGKISVENESVIVVGGGVTGLETAEWLGLKQNKVTVIEMTDKVGGNLYPSINIYLQKAITKEGGQILKNTTLLSVADGEISVADSKTAFTRSIKTDRVILAMGVRPDRSLEKDFSEAFDDKLILIGDADKPGQIIDGLHAAYDRAFVFEA